MGQWVKICLIAVMALMMNVQLTAAEDEEVLFVAGIVVEVSSSSIKVKEVGFDEETEVVVIFNDQTEWENISSAKDILVNDEVYIDYIEEGGKNLAVNVYKLDESEYEYGNDDEGYIDEGMDPDNPAGYEVDPEMIENDETKI